MRTLFVAAIGIVGGCWNSAPPAGHTVARPQPRTGTDDVVAAPAPAAVVDQGGGFDLYVSPANVTAWRLDGEVRTDRLPVRIRGIAPGSHEVAIDAPPGFISKAVSVMVERGKAPKVEISLELVTTSKD